MFNPQVAGSFRKDHRIHDLMERRPTNILNPLVIDVVNMLAIQRELSIGSLKHICPSSQETILYPIVRGRLIHPV